MRCRARTDAPSRQRRRPAPSTAATAVVTLTVAFVLCGCVVERVAGRPEEFFEETQDVAAFYHGLRRATLLLMTISTLSTLAYTALAAARDPEGGERARADAFIPMLLCSLCLAVAIGAILLLPGTIIASEVLVHFKGNYYVQWLNEELVFGLWNSVFVGTNVALGAVAPFAYFLFEAEGCCGMRGATGRAVEAATLVCLVDVLLCGIAYVTAAAWLRQAVPTFSLGAIVRVAYSIVSLSGAVLFLAATSGGFYRLCNWAYGLFIPYGRKLRMIDKVYKLEVEELVVRQRLEALDSDCGPRLERQRRLSNARRPGGAASRVNSNVQASANGGGGGGGGGGSSGSRGVIYSTVSDDPADSLLSTRAGLEADLACLEAELAEAKAIAATNLVWRTLKFALFTTLTLGLSTAISLQAFFNQVAGFLVDWGIWETRTAAGPVYLQIGLGKASRGILVAVQEVILISYLAVAAVSGVYRLPLLRRLSPALGKTSVRGLIGNSVLCVILGSALPVVSRLLGLTSFDLMGYYADTSFLGNRSVVLVYNMAFLVSTVPFTLRIAARVWRLWQDNKNELFAAAWSVDEDNGGGGGGGGDDPFRAGSPRNTSPRFEAPASLLLPSSPTRAGPTKKFM